MGFRAGYLTVYCIFVLTAIAREYLSKDRKLYMNRRKPCKEW